MGMAACHLAPVVHSSPFKTTAPVPAQSAVLSRLAIDDSIGAGPAPSSCGRGRGRTSCRLTAA